jgi:PPK2 family polyphosphate:nucleotide phosphotransferase
MLRSCFFHYTGFTTNAFGMTMNKSFFEAWRVKKDSGFNLESVATLPMDIDDFDADKQDMKALFDKLNKLQTTLYAGKTRGLLLVLQGMDTSGKDGVIRHVFSHISPLGVHAHAFSAPTEEEKRHDFLWRIHSKVPGRGDMAIFNRSHYEDVLVTRVRGWISEKTVQSRCQDILNFEAMLHDEGITVLKCFLHISKKEQKKRLQARLDEPSKHWKLQASDFEDRKLWPDFMQAYQEALSITSTENAPWYIVPADSKPYRDYFLAELLVHTLEGMKLSMPQPTFDLSKVKLD